MFTRSEPIILYWTSLESDPGVGSSSLLHDENVNAKDNKISDKFLRFFIDDLAN